MPTRLHKTRKSIAKKRNGDVTALHEKSRDSLRLHKAGIRDQRLEKLAAARSKREQPIVDRVSFFHDAVTEKGTEPFELSAIQELITTFIHQHDEEYDAVRKTRRPGRPATPREDLLKMKIDNLNTEYEKGFSLPNLTNVEDLEKMEKWDGSWTQLTSVSWIKVSSAGSIRSTEFPSKGLQ